MLQSGVLVVAALLALSSSTFGQLRQQSFQLEPGWNSVFLEVDAIPETADELFSGLPIEKVFMRAPEPLSQPGAECLGPDDPNCVVFDDTMWRTWYPPSPAATVVNTLNLIRGGNVYLIKATKATALSITGAPSGFDPRYRPGYNLRGFYVSNVPTNTPTIDAYLQPAEQLDSTSVYQMQTDGRLSLVSGASQIVSGKGYWVPSTEELDYNGLIDVDKSTLRGVDFGRTQITHSMTLRNLSSSNANVSVAHLISLSSSPLGFAFYAGDIPIHWLDFGGGDAASEMLQWNVLGTHSFLVPPWGIQTALSTLNIGVRRVGLAVATVDIERQGSLYQGLMEIKDDHGFRRLVALSNEVEGSLSASTAGAVSSDRPGLYLGTVRMNKVAWVTAGARIWTNEDAGNPEFEGLKKCEGGVNDGRLCLPGRNQCSGTPEIDFMDIVCTDTGSTVVECTTSDDCPLNGPCNGGFCDCPAGSTCVEDCPGGNCRGFCIGGDNAGVPCIDATECAGAEDGVCSVDLAKDVLRPVRFEFEFPVLVHLSSSGEYKMLTEVTLLTTPENHLVLKTPECPTAVCDGLDGALTVNGEPFARRVSTAAYSFENDLIFDSGGSFTSILAGTTTIAPNDPLNPFRHSFHPDHDCLDKFGNPLQGNALESECFQVTRTFTFSFESSPPDGRSELDWGDSVLGGVYRELVSGIHKETITAEGRFELRRVSILGALNTPIDLGGAP